MVGKVLGHYEVVARLGTGGMGEVYRARDHTLDRDVALKVLPEGLGDAPERLERFEREAKLLAALNHDNIATIHGFEHSDGVRFIAMELVEGDTIAERIARSGRIPVDEAIDIGIQIAAALEEAHDNGVIHRDLKPANVKVTPDGKVKVLDFGLAKALAGREPDGTADLSQFPTIPAETHTGVILGTAAYMSPEQANGQPLDPGTDIWSLGAVLYEMLAGRAAFGGETVTEVLAAIVRDEPDWTALPPETPPGVVRLIRRCLRKKRKQRLRHAGDARLELEEAVVGAVDGTERQPAVPEQRSTVLPWALAGVFALIAVGLVWFGGALSSDSPSMSARVPVDLWPGVELSEGLYRSVAIAPDGSRVAFIADQGNTEHLFVRRLDELEGTSLVSDDNLSTPSFSPDGQWILFHMNAAYYRISVDGGDPFHIVDATLGFGATWSGDERIVYASGPSQPLRVAGISGGDPETLATREGAIWPSLARGGDWIVYTATAFGQARDESDVRAHNLSTGEDKLVLEAAGSDARYAGFGYLVFGRGTSLLGVPFDPRSATVTGRGAPETLIEKVRFSAVRGGSAFFDVADDGTLVYVPARPVRDYEVVQVSLDGTEMGIVVERGPYLASEGFSSVIRLSPDGRSLALVEREGPPEMVRPRKQVSIHSLDGAPRRRLDIEGDAYSPVWSPDGERLAVSVSLSPTQEQDQGGEIFARRIDQAGEAQLLFGGSLWALPQEWKDDLMLFRNLTTGDGSWHVWKLELGVDGGNDATPLLTRSSWETSPRIHPEGRCLAFARGGTDPQILVTSLGDPDSGVEIIGAGSRPKWSRDGNRLFFRDGRAVMVADVLGRDPCAASLPRRLFEWSTAGDYEVAADGVSLFLFRGVDNPVEIEAPLVYYFGWAQTLGEANGR